MCDHSETAGQPWSEQQAALHEVVSAQIPVHADAILESLPDALIIVDHEGRIALLNQQAETLFGYARGELTGQAVEVLVPEAARVGHRASRARYMSDPQLVPMGTGSMRRHAVRKDGIEVPVDVGLSPLRTDAGVLVVCTVRDVTERTRATEAVTAHLATEQAVSAILRASLAATSLDELLTSALDRLFAVPWIALQSKGAVFLLGASPEHLVMRAQRGLTQPVLGACAKVARGACLCGVAASTRQPVFAGAIDDRHTTRYEGMEPHGHYCLPIISGDRVHGVLALYLNEGHPWRPEEESFLRSIADVLAGAIVRLTLTDDLRRSEERFALAVNGSDAGIWDWQIAEDRIFFSSRWKSMLGFADDELPDQFAEWERRVHPDDRADALATLRDYLDGRRETYEIEHRLQHRDGTYRWILSRGSAVRDERGRPYRMVGSHLDITRSKAAEEAVRANTAKLIAAQRIQQHLLPRAAPRVEGFDISARLYPADFVAGDHFDYLPMRDGSLGVMIADVSGHGFDSALIMASFHAYLRLFAQTHADVRSIVRRANQLLASEIEVGRYVTMFFGRLEPGTGRFTYLNQGHPAAHLLDVRGNVKACLESSCMPAGLFADAVALPQASTVTLAPGDLLICVTDGVTEAESPAGVAFGTDRMLDVARRNLAASADAIISALWDAIGEFRGRTTVSDDVTMLIVKALDRG